MSSDVVSRCLAYHTDTLCNEHQHCAAAMFMNSSTIKHVDTHAGCIHDMGKWHDQVAHQLGVSTARRETSLLHSTCYMWSTHARALCLDCILAQREVGELLAGTDSLARFLSHGERTTDSTGTWMSMASHDRQRINARNKYTSDQAHDTGMRGVTNKAHPIASSIEHTVHPSSHLI